MNFKETMAAARAQRLKQAVEYDIPELGGKLKFGPPLAGPALDSQAMHVAGTAPTKKIIANMLIACCMNDEGGPLFKDEAEVNALLAEITGDAMAALLKASGDASKTKKAEGLPSGNSEASQSAA